MLKISDLCKIKDKVQLNHIHLSVNPGEIVSITCHLDLSDLLVRLIIGEEVAAKGEIFLNQITTQSINSHLMKDIGIVWFEEGYYDRMTVEGYLKFFKNVINSDHSVEESMVQLGLMDVADLKIAKLSSSQKRRLSLARESLKTLKLLIMQEPIFNMDKYEAKLIVAYLDSLSQKNVAILTTSTSYKETLLTGGELYSIEETGIEKISADTYIESAQLKLSGKDDFKKNYENNRNKVEEDVLHFKIDKIPAKIDDRILLFNPVEIDYIESEKGNSFLNIRGERFMTSMTLNDLEDRLNYLGFFRCHRSYLVNLQRVREIITWSRNSYSLVLDDKLKSTIPLSKNRIEEMKNILNLN